MALKIVVSFRIQHVCGTRLNSTLRPLLAYALAFTFSAMIKLRLLKSESCLSQSLFLAYDSWVVICELLFIWLFRVCAKLTHADLFVYLGA